MIAIATSPLVAYVSGAGGPDVEATDLALAHRQAALPAVTRDSDFGYFSRLAGLRLFPATLR